MSIVAHVPGPAILALVSRLGGRWSGRTAMCRCPLHEDRTPSLAIRQGDRGLLVTCFAGCDRRDVLKALGGHPGAGLAPERRLVAREMPFARIWQEARAIEGTLAERYLREVRAITAPLGDVRFHPHCPCGKSGSTVRAPALVAALRVAGRLQAIQRIYLDREGQATGAKLCLGSAAGAAWTNGCGSPLRELGLCEGLETAAAYTSLTGIPAWATMGAMRFDKIALPPGIERLLLLADNDAEGHRACARALRAYARPGLVVTPLWPHGRCNDWADVLGQAAR